MSGTSGAFEGSVNRIAAERCNTRGHKTTTGFPCASCVAEVRKELGRKRRKAHGEELTEDETARVRARLGL